MRPEPKGREPKSYVMNTNHGSMQKLRDEETKNQRHNTVQLKYQRSKKST
jgi:hypothetical protein